MVCLLNMPVTLPRKELIRHSLYSCNFHFSILNCLGKGFRMYWLSKINGQSKEICIRVFKASRGCGSDSLFLCTLIT